MTGEVCAECGAAAAPGQHFCSSCGGYLGDLGAPDRPDPPTDDPPTTIVPPPAGPLPPEVTVAGGDVVLEGARQGSVELRVTNRSSIVEGYRVDAVDAPPWLALTVPPARLMPGDRATVRLGLAARSERPVVAQRLRLTLRLHPESDPRVRADVEIVLVVPRIGGPAAIRAEPAVVRLRDAAQGRFAVHLDNRGGNHPRRYVLSGSDDERAVRFAFGPPAVEVPPGEVVTVPVQVWAPPPAAGERAERTLTVRAAAEPAEEGAPPVAVVRLVQETSAAPVDVPVRVRLEPSALHTVDSPVAELTVVVDNRAGHRERVVHLGGRDPQRQLGFAFRDGTLRVPAGGVQATPARLHAPLPHPGEQAARAFTVVAVDGRHESEASGSWEQRAAPAPITTARLTLSPQKVVTRNGDRGRLRVQLDNRASAAPLSVRLHGTDPQRAVRFAFRPDTLQVAPGGVGWADVRISAPRPGGRTTLSRPFSVVAQDGHGHVQAEGEYEQSAGDRRPLWRAVLTVLGALLIAVGCFRDWLAGDPDSLLPSVANVTNGVRQAVRIGAPVDAQEAAQQVRVLQPGERIVTLLLAAVMVFGLTGVTGRLTRFTGLLVAVTMVALLVFWRSTGLSPADGALLVVLGGLIGFAGGLFVRR